jgi:hypothetical protein
MTFSRLIPCVSAAALFASILGCNAGLTATPAVNTVSVTGNWQLASADAAAARLPALSGELKGSGSAITGLFHSNAASACVAPSSVIELTGSANASSVVTLTGANVAGGTLTVRGTLAADGKSFSSASYQVTGGSCAFPKAAVATAQAYSSISGNYSGTFSDTTGNALPVTATLTQTPDSDTDGNFQLSGTGSFADGRSPCIASPATVSNSQVTGGNFSLTYTDPSSQNSVAASGTFSTDGTTLTISSWTLTGNCGTFTGTGLLTKQTTTN